MNDYKIKQLYEKMEMEIISSMKRNYQRHLNEETKTGFKYTQWQAEKLKELKRYQRENQNIIGGYTNNLSDEISKHLQEELKQGSINAIKQYNKLLNQNLKPDKIMNKSFFKINDRKVNALIKSVNNDLKNANTAVLRMTNDQYRQVIHKSAFFVSNGVFTEQQAARMATKELTELQLTKAAIDEANKDFLSHGLACIEYSDGRRVNIASYCQMAVRTASLRAQLMGEGDFRKSIGRTLVQATSHGGACPICKKWEKHIFIDDVYSGGTSKDGNYMLLSTAMKQGFLHPNCRHGLTTYYPELEDIEDENYEEHQANMDYINQKNNYIERNIKRYDRLKKGSVDSLNIKYYDKKEKQWKKEKDLFIGNNYYNVTKLWLENSTPGKGTIKDATSVTINGEVFKVNKLNKIIHENNEVKVAEWLKKTFGGEIEYLPNITEKDGVSCADYFFKNEFWDLKELSGNGKRTLEDAIKRKKKQSSNFIIDISNSKMEKEELLKQAQKIYNSRSLDWVDKLILKKNDELIAVLQKNRLTPTHTG